MRVSTRRKPLFERLKRGLEEGIQHLRGELELRTFERAIPPRIDAKKVITLRRHSRLSAEAFARLLNVSPTTVRSWEAGKTKPSQSSLRLLQLLEIRPDIQKEVTALSEGIIPVPPRKRTTPTIRMAKKIIQKS